MSEDGHWWCDVLCVAFFYALCLLQTMWLLYFGVWAWLIGTAVLFVVAFVID